MSSSTATAPRSEVGALTLIDGSGASRRRRRAAPDRLVRRVVGTSGVELVLIVAPAGYGKTTLLEGWAAADARPFVRISLAGVADPDDAVVACCAQLRAAGVNTTPCIVAVDDAEVVTEPALLTLLSVVGDELPDGSLVVLSARSEPHLPIGRLRAERRLLELGPRELALTHGEAAALLRGAGAGVDAAQVNELMVRTEGWVTGLHLAALALGEQLGDSGAVARFDGSDHVVADYFRGEVLARLPLDHVEFLKRASLLEQLSGPLCDAVLERHDSGRLLHHLSRSELPLFAQDRTEEHFRCHRLFGDMLRAEMHRTEPDVADVLHRRASAWFEDHGDLPAAIDHAIAGDDVERAGHLLWRAVAGYAWDGRRSLIDEWLGRIPDPQIERHPALALVAATSSLAAGRSDEAHAWAATAARCAEAEPEPWRSRLQAGTALVRAAVASDPAPTWSDDVARAVDAEPSDSPWRTLSCLLLGVAASLRGEDPANPAVLQEGARRGAVGAPGLEALCEAELALEALLEEDWEHGAGLAERARARVDNVGGADPVTSALTYAATAFARAYRGRVEEASQDVRSARQMLTELDGFAPWYDAQARLALARAELRLSNVGEARALLAEASRFAAHLPEPCRLRDWIDDAWARTDTFAAESLAGPSSLTIAELRVLRFLPSHLAFREIAERLNVSANTVKTQAHAVYRKLDASSRSAAVARARQCGLLDA